MAHGRTIRASLMALASLPALLAGCAADSVVPGDPALVSPDDPAPAVAAAKAAPAAAGELPDGLVLVGMESGRVDDLLGRPEMVMNAGPAQWWRYELGDCAIEVFLIAPTDAAGPDELVVSHVTVRTLSGAARETGRRSCRALDTRIGGTEQLAAHAQEPDIRAH
jgi:hypothetical protein